MNEINHLIRDVSVILYLFTVAKEQLLTMYNMWLVIFVTELDFVQLYLELWTMNYVSYT